MLMKDAANGTDKAGGARRPWRFWLEHDGRAIALPVGVLVIGRSSGCQLVVDDPMVSRRHAELHVGAESVRIVDLGSVNGLFVNGRRVQGGEALLEGQELRIGSQRLVLRSMLESQMPRVGHPGAVTLTDTGRTQQMVSESEVTFSGETLDLLGNVAEKVLALGRADEAERMLANSLGNLLREAQAQRAMPPDLMERAARYSVLLAEATGKGRWVDYVFALFGTISRPLPPDLIDRLYDVLRSTSGINLVALRAYLAALRAAEPGFGPSERFALHRLEGLERLASR